MSATLNNNVEVSREQVGELSLIQGKVEVIEFDPHLEKDLKRVDFIADDGKQYQLHAGPDIEDLSILSGQKVVVLGQIQLDFYDKPIIVASGFRCLPKVEKGDSLISSHKMRMR